MTTNIDTSTYYLYLHLTFTHAIIGYFSDICNYYHQSFQSIATWTQATNIQRGYFGKYSKKNNNFSFSSHWCYPSINNLK